MNENRKMAHNVILIISAIVILFSLAIFCFVPANNSDYVEGVLWAEATLKSGQLLSTEFYYPYAIPVGANLFILPFLAVFGTSQLSNSLGMLLMYSILLFVCYLFVGSLTNRKVDILVGMAIIALAYRSAVGENQLHHILYYQLGFVCFLGLFAMVFRLMTNKGSEKWNWMGLCLFALWSSVNGLVNITLSALPVLIGLFVLLLINSEKRTTIIKSIIVIFFSLVLGLLLYKLIMIGVQESGYIEKSGSYSFLSIRSWAENINKLPVGWFELFVLFNPTGINFIGINGFEIIVSIVISLVVGILPLICINKSIKGGSLDKKDAVLASSIFIWIVCLAQYIFMRGSESNRVLYNIVLVNFAVFALWYIDKKESFRNKTVIRIRSLIAILLSVYTVLLPVKAEWSSNSNVIEMLQEKGLTYGYGTYWNSNYFTVESANNIKIRPISIDRGMIRPREYQCDTSWYKKEQIESDSWFILLDKSQYNELIGGTNQFLADISTEAIRIDDYIVLVFPTTEWDKAFNEKIFSYSFNSDLWSKGCTTEGFQRTILNGGISYGPYMSMNKNEICRVTLLGEALESAKITVYSLSEDVTIQPYYELKTNNKIVMSFETNVNLNNMEIAIENSSDLPIIISKETIEIMGK